MIREKRGRYQPPVHSPLGPRALLHAASTAVGRRDPRLRLAARLREAYGADHVVLTGSGTDALHLALASVLPAIPAPATVAIPSYSCFDVATAAVGSGATLVGYDLDPTTLAPAPGSLRRALEEGARAVVVAPLWGVPVDWEVITAVTRPFGAIVIEDAAQGHGAAWQGRPLGTLAPISVLSFGRGKGWTGGSGGAVLFRSPAPWSDPLTLVGARTSVAELGGVGLAAAQWMLARPSLYALPTAIPGLGLGETRYRPPRVARPMLRTAAELLERTVETAAAEGAYRRACGAWYQQQLRGHRNVTAIMPPAGATAGWLRFPVLVRTAADAIVARGRRLGVAQGYPRPLTALPPVRERSTEWSRKAHWPGAETLIERLVTLPTHSLLTLAERQALLRTIAR